MAQKTITSCDVCGAIYGKNIAKYEEAQLTMDGHFMGKLHSYQYDLCAGCYNTVMIGIDAALREAKINARPPKES